MYSYKFYNNVFYPYALEGSYRNSNSWPDDGVDVEGEVYIEFTGAPPEGKERGIVDGMPAWVNIPSPLNSDLLKGALSTLSTEYQNDIEVLNRAWLAAAVNDGVNETSKKDAVLVQINSRKAKYATDRAVVISQYPV